MNITITARHFKAPAELQQYAERAVSGLAQVYEGIVSAEVILEERARGGGDKVAEVLLSVYREHLVAKESSTDIMRSVQACVEKLERQLRKYKAKLHGGKRAHGDAELGIDVEVDMIGGA